MKILITGSTGQLGKALKQTFSKKVFKKSIQLYTPTRTEFDLTNLNECKKIIENIAPDFLINSAAFTNVEKAEDDFELADIINSAAPRLFSELLNKQGGNLVQISTDYVFDGEQKTPYLPQQDVNPINKYGESKAKGERFIFENFENPSKFNIVRTSWLISPWGNNFITKIINLLIDTENNDSIKVIYDQIGCTTSVLTLSELIFLIVEKKIAHQNIFPNILHWSDGGETNWFDIASYVKNLIETNYESRILRNIVPVRSDQLQFKASRPKYSLLDSSQSCDLLNIEQSNWRKEIKKIIDISYKMEN